MIKKKQKERKIDIREEGKKQMGMEWGEESLKILNEVFVLFYQNCTLFVKELFLPNRFSPTNPEAATVKIDDVPPRAA